MKKSLTKSIIKTLFFPFVWLRRIIVHHVILWQGKHRPQKRASKLYKRAMGKDLDWDNPKDLNEKINWMKFNTDLSEWTRLSDKYRVREYLKERGREDLLVKLYGVWENANDIDFDALPENFVLKSNHGCGTVILVKDKNTINKPVVRQQMNDWLKRSYGILTAEPHYLNIKPLLIAEELLENDNQNSKSLVDYKLFCVEGEVYCIMVCADRAIGKGMKAMFYDTDWNPKPEMLAGAHVNDNVCIPKPSCLDELLKAARDLSKGHHFVRVDFYISKGKVYFGEMTFTPRGGYTNTVSYPHLLQMGTQIKL